MKFLKPFIAVFLLLLISFSLNNKYSKTKKMDIDKKIDVAYFASGCFWCVEAIYESIIGVEEAVSGYAGGFTKKPTYKTIGTGKTGHAETVAVFYNSKKVSFKTLVKVFFASHDPTTKNGQYPDFGSQYRSIVFYETEEQKRVIKKVLNLLNKEIYNGKIVTEVKKLDVFYRAEDYHQDFKKSHPNNSYIQRISIPRLNRFKAKFPLILKKEK